MSAQAGQIVSRLRKLSNRKRQVEERFLTKH